MLAAAASLAACDDDANTEPAIGDPELRVTCDLNIALPSASAADGTIAYEVLYPVGTVVATAESSASWLRPAFSTDGAKGKSSLGLPNFTGRISYHASANRGPARTAELVLDYAGVSRVTLTIRQPAGSAEEDKPDKPEEPDKPDTPDEPVVPQPAGATLCSGWAELPATIEKSGWHYTYHITDRTNGQGNPARNYAVCYSREKGCAVWVAAPMHDFYAKGVGREDNYRSDPNFDFEQPGSWNFSSTELTRGHLLGSSDRLVSRLANDQVMYYSNIAPQLQTGFNTGGGTWNRLEEWVDSQWHSEADTTYQVIGCYWDPAKPKQEVNGTEVPTHYYKVLLRTKNHVNKWVVNCSRDELQCIAVMVEHKSFSERQSMSVAELERRTGLSFFANVPNAPKDTYNASDWGL